jgi:hypothetical protein
MGRWSAWVCRAVVGCLVILGGVAGAGEEPKWKPLWDGKSLDGWHKQGGGTWEVQDGVLVGRNAASEPQHGHLVTDRKFTDFTIRLKYKSVKGNSGFYFRVAEVGGNVGVNGFQAEIDPRNDPAGLYETGGRGWVARPTAEFVKEHFKPGEWNEMIVTARGRDITTTLNGAKAVELKNDPTRWVEGPIALQLHGGADVEVYFKDVEMLEEPTKEGK